MKVVLEKSTKIYTVNEYAFLDTNEILHEC